MIGRWETHSIRCVLKTPVDTPSHIGVSPRALWLAGAFLCDCMIWDERGGGLTGQPLGPYSNHGGGNERKPRGLGEFWLTMLYIPAFTHKRRPYSATTVYPTINSFTLDSFLALTICGQRKTYGWCFTPGPMAGGYFLA